MPSHDFHAQGSATDEKWANMACPEAQEMTGEKPPPKYLTGWRLHAATIALCLSIMLPNFEISIVSTSLVAITNDLEGLSQSSWIVIAYLLTYTSFLVIWAKLSDIFGRKLSIVTAVAIFTLFSGGCGAAQTTTQLIVFRAFQGIGGSGAYALTAVMVFELVPQTEYAAYTALVSAVFALSLLLGPLLGGAINNHTTWRWVFLLNVPAGVIVMILLLLTIPSGFPHHGQPSYVPRKARQLVSKITTTRLDSLGTFLLLSASLLLVTGLQIVGLKYAWDSAAVLSLLIISVPLWPAFLCWEWYISRQTSSTEPVLPFRFIKNRIWIAMILNTFLVGTSFTVPVIELPLRFQNVYNFSPFKAGLGLLPFAFTTAIGSTVASVAASKSRIPLIYILTAGTALQVIGFVLLSLVPTSEDVYHPQYGFQVIAALGVGANAGILILMTPFIVEKRDQSVAMGATVQFRMMGGAIGLAVVTSVFNSYTQSRLSKILLPDQLDAVLDTSHAIAALDPTLRSAVRTIFAEAYRLQFRILIGTAAAQYLATALMWQRKPLRAA